MHILVQPPRRVARGYAPGCTLRSAHPDAQSSQHPRTQPDQSLEYNAHKTKHDSKSQEAEEGKGGAMGQAATCRVPQIPSLRGVGLWIKRHVGEQARVRASGVRPSGGSLPLVTRRHAHVAAAWQAGCRPFLSDEGQCPGPSSEGHSPPPDALRQGARSTGSARLARVTRSTLPQVARWRRVAPVPGRTLAAGGLRPHALRWQVEANGRRKRVGPIAS